MTVEEMKKAIEDKCSKHDVGWCHNECPLKESQFCFSTSDDVIIRKNYKLMFGKEESEMKNKFKMEDIKAGYLVRIKEDNSLLLAIQSKNEMDFYDETLCYVCSESDMGFDDSSELYN